MRILSVAVGIVLLSSSAWAQVTGQIVGLKLSKETVLGSLKMVEGSVVGPSADSHNPPQDVVVWVNGISAQVNPDGSFRVLIPNEPVKLFQAWQKALGILATYNGRDLARVQRFKTLSSGPEIRDLLNKSDHQDVTSGGGDGGIRDLLAKPRESGTDNEVTSGGGDGGIRDLLAKPKSPTPDAEVTSGGGDGGIRDLLAKPTPAPVTSGGGDGGIRDLLNKPAGGRP